MILKIIRAGIAISIATAALALSALPALGETTEVKIQVRATDAKFVGTGVGGM